MMATPPNETLKGMRILAVEDQSDLRDMLTLLLEQQGAEVTGCESAEEAFDLLVSGAPFDAALFDISMPGEDGLALVGRVRNWESRQAPSHLPVIALTAHVTYDMKRQCEAAGFDHYLPKPVSPGTLFSTIRRLALLH
jgi:two-component system CheB/CheR fusion protein